MEDLSCDIVAKCHDRTKGVRRHSDPCYHLASADEAEPAPPPTHTHAALLGETPRYKLIFHATVGENQLQVRTRGLIRARRKPCRRLARGAPARRRRERALAVRRACASRRVASGTRSTTNARPPPFPTAASTLQPSASLYSLNECAAATQTTAQAPVRTMCVPLEFASAAASVPLRSHSFIHSISTRLRLWIYSGSLNSAPEYTPESLE